MVETDVVEPMAISDFVAQVADIANAFITRAKRANEVFQSDVAGLRAQPGFGALQQMQPELVRAIFEAEMQRMAREVAQE